MKHRKSVIRQGKTLTLNSFPNFNVCENLFQDCPDCYSCCLSTKHMFNPPEFSFPRGDKSVD